MSNHEIAFDVITLIIAVVLASIAIVKAYQLLKQHNESILLQTFETITEYIDNQEVLDNRKIVYSAHENWEVLIKEFPSCTNDTIENINHKENIYKQINHAAWKTAVAYDRVGFLLEQNKHLEEKIIEFHGITILKIYIIIKGLMIKWTDTRGRSTHPYFVRISEKIWNNNEYRKKAIMNLIISQPFLYNSSGKRISIKEYKNWATSIFKIPFESDLEDEELKKYLA